MKGINDMDTVWRDNWRNNMNSENNEKKESEEPKKPIIPHPFSTHISVWFALVILTGLTITVAGLNLGNFSVLGAILIATAKSSLVVMFFMQLRYEDRIFKLMMGLALLTLATIMVLTFVDVSYR